MIPLIIMLSYASQFYKLHEPLVRNDYYIYMQQCVSLAILSSFIKGFFFFLCISTDELTFKFHLILAIRLIINFTWSNSSE